MKIQSRKQAGFINGALIIGIALMAVVVGAIAMASSSSTTDISKQKIKTAAAVGMKRMSDAVEAFQINAADAGVAAAEAAIVLPVFPKGFQAGEEPDPVTYTATKLSVPGVDPDICTEINKTLNVNPAPADASGVTAAGTREACTADYTYVRVVRG